LMAAWPPGRLAAWPPGRGSPGRGSLVAGIEQQGEHVVVSEVVVQKAVPTRNAKLSGNQ